MVAVSVREVAVVVVVVAIEDEEDTLLAIVVVPVVVVELVGVAITWAGRGVSTWT